MATFEEFIESIQADGNDGKAFEHFCKWFLLNDPYWKTQVDKAWLFSEWPDRWGPDNGIDLIFKHKNGEIWAVQAKCYDEKYAVSKKDMDSFLTESNRAVVKQRLLLASTNIMGSNAQRACAGQEKPVTLYLLKDFEAAQVEYPSHISKLTSAKPKAKPVPDPHQTRAIDDVVAKFGGYDRGQLIMACGTGKTFTTLWIKEALAAQTTLVLVPSLNLLSQTLNEWAFAAKDSFDVLCVCSDKTVGKRDKEDMALGEAPFSVTSELSVISDFISNDGQKVIFCTYQSSDLIAEVQSDKSINPFDLVIADEAHRCSGKSDAAFSKVLDGEAIRATKRLFTTATPRLYSSSVKKAAADRGIEVYGMDDEAVFGPLLHTLTFGQAIAEDLLNDYQVVIVGVDQPMIKEWIENQELLGLNPNNVTDARTLAAKIGLLKSIKDYGLTRVISFHSRVNAARDFAAEVSELVDLIEPSNRPKGTLWSSFVSGAMRTTDRIIEISRLKSLESADIGVLANARCLSEGVDVPSLDGIAFIDPRGSQVDIIQAVGRAIRKVRGVATQTKGTIVLPVFIEEGDDAEAQIEASNFKPVWDVLQALRSHDEVLADHLDQYRINIPKRPSTTLQTLDNRIIFDLPTTVDPSFSSALRTVLVTATTSSWYFWFGLLEEYKSTNGHVLVTADYETLEGFKLGDWVTRQRQRKASLLKKQIEKLDLIGFIWDPIEAAFINGMKELKLYYDTNGDCLVHKDFISESGFKLGTWVSVLRRRKEKLSIENIDSLNKLSFIWDPHFDKWFAKYKILEALYKKTGKIDLSKVEPLHQRDELRRWMGKQRTKAGKLSEKQINLLNLIDFDWDPLRTQWFNGFKALTKFKEQFGSCDIPNKYKLANGFNLYLWAAKQRQLNRKGKLSKEFHGLLNTLGFIWEYPKDEEKWSVAISELIDFKKTYGNCRVSNDFKSKSGFKLGQWVSTTRIRYKIMIGEPTSYRLEPLTKSQVTELERIGFEWDALSARWDEGLERLVAYKKSHGTVSPPIKYNCEDGFGLGKWVFTQRRNKLSISKERKQRLDAIGFIWDPYHNNWMEKFEILKRFSELYGHTKLPHSTIFENTALGDWTYRQRVNFAKGKLGQDYIILLEKLQGWTWKTND